MIKNLKSRIKQPRARMFLVFLLCAFLAWLLNRLSETYTHQVVFNLEFQNPPDSLIFLNPPQNTIPVSVRANGFQLLRYQLNPKHLTIDLGSLEKRNSSYFISPRVYNAQIEPQMVGNINIFEFPNDTLYMDLHPVVTRQIPVQPETEIELAQGYMMDGPLLVEPALVEVRGPAEEIDTLLAIPTVPLKLKEVTENFERTLLLQKAESLTHTNFSTEQVSVTGSVFRFSESVIDLPVTVLNLPESFEIRTFPATVGVLCKGRIGDLKELNPSDFQLAADFTNPDPETGRLSLVLTEQPESVYSATLLESSVEFIVKRK
ncbi:CdaR family protein [Robiginitalea sp. IMCC43444]|uniref:CdaR family protein n=1 Tax=Robiginitalea sp. IMCC43444 TaxID=3459121 RepID=UPI0040411047